MFIMWSVMMVAMMTPSAAPMILAYSRISRQRTQQQSPLLATAVFLSGYLIVWTVFSGKSLMNGSSLMYSCPS